mmetsp:Transcript_33778/g.73858  ORF Transcript_33778/g.73858 Transcript_33778/m.73858 type:complete len:439 (+) Transcript_33778:41-1357(+)
MDQLEDLLQRAGTLTLGRLADVNRQDSGAVHDLVESVAEQLLKDTDPKVLELLASHNAPLRNSPTLSPNDPQLTDLHALPFVMRRGDDTDMEEVVCNRGLEFDHSTTKKVTWMRWKNSRPQSVLIIKKKGDPECAEKLMEMANWLDSLGVVVVVEPDVRREVVDADDGLTFVRTFNPGEDLCSPPRLDLVICIGGDGTLTWAAGLFNTGPMPPTIAFAAGSLGFLTPISLSSYMSTLFPVIQPDRHPKHRILLTCRMRLFVRVERARPLRGDSKVECQVLNEVLIHRGASGQLVKLECYVDGSFITLVQGDGVILATPTGSTAYSLAAGGAMVHPSVPAILMTPVCPHSLSFRPVVLPDSAQVKIVIPPTARSSANASFDGRTGIDLMPGDAIHVSVSRWPLPAICARNETADWFKSVNGALKWNDRAEQKALAGGVK